MINRAELEPGTGRGESDDRFTPRNQENLETHRSPALFERLEANVRSYCRQFPAIFSTCAGAWITDTEGRRWLDFFTGAGSLNYGHNEPYIKGRVIDYLQNNGIMHALDMHTAAKHDLLEAFERIILKPRDLDYKITFPGPTGTNAVETALKFARMATGRTSVIAFTNAFHGMTLGSLALSGNRDKRAGAGIGLDGVMRLPYDGYLGPDVDTSDLLKRMLEDSSSGLDHPAAIIVETVQGEGGLNVASIPWLRRIEQLAREHGALFIIDDIQNGCGRSGRFFSFENTGVYPDIVCLSKSISGLGLPLSLMLFRPEFDVLQPGQHNGTFRGHNLAFVAATAALELWQQPSFRSHIEANVTRMHNGLAGIVARHPEHGAHLRGRGLMVGLSWEKSWIASEVSKAAYRLGLLAETSGADDQVLKLLPPVTIAAEDLQEGLGRVEQAVETVLASTV